MTRREAAQILGVRESAAEERVKDAHRKLMIANHPDSGGSGYIASKVVELTDFDISLSPSLRHTASCGQNLAATLCHLTSACWLGERSIAGHRAAAALQTFLSQSLASVCRSMRQRTCCWGSRGELGQPFDGCRLHMLSCDKQPQRVAWTGQPNTVSACFSSSDGQSRVSF